MSLKTVGSEFNDCFNEVATASEFCEQAQVGIDVYISHCKYQVEPTHRN